MVLFRVSALDWICFTLLIIGALNWGLIGLLDLSAVAMLLDPVFRPTAADLVARAIYVLVGLAGLYFFYPLYRMSQAGRE